MDDSTDPNAKLTIEQFLMEVRKHAIEQAEHSGHRWHLLLPIILFFVAMGFAAAGFEFHVNELYFVAVGTILAMVVVYAYARTFSAYYYYAIYSREWERANALRKELKSVKQTWEGCLQLIRMIEDGERSLTIFDARGHDTKLALTGTGGLQAWYRNTLAILEKEYAAHRSHFEDFGEFGSGGPAARTMAVRSGAATVELREEIETLLKRIRGLRDLYLTSLGQKAPATD